MPVAWLGEAEPEKLTLQPAGVGTWRFAPDRRRIYFITADTVDADEKLRRESGSQWTSGSGDAAVESVGARPRAGAHDSVDARLHPDGVQLHPLTGTHLSLGAGAGLRFGESVPANDDYSGNAPWTLGSHPVGSFGQLIGQLSWRQTPELDERP